MTTATFAPSALPPVFAEAAAATVLAPAAHPPVLADAASATVLALVALPPVLAEAAAATLLAPAALPPMLAEAAAATILASAGSPPVLGLLMSHFLSACPRHVRAADPKARRARTYTCRALAAPVLPRLVRLPRARSKLAPQSRSENLRCESARRGNWLVPTPPAPLGTRIRSHSHAGA